MKKLITLTLAQALAALAEASLEMIYDDVHMVFANGNFVLAVSDGLDFLYRRKSRYGYRGSNYKLFYCLCLKCLCRLDQLIASFGAFIPFIADPIDDGYYVSNKCIGCKICYSRCPQKSIDITKKPVEIDQKHCIHCGNCYEICPARAIIKKG